MKSITDSQALAKINHGDNDGFNQIISTYYDDIYRFLVYKTKNREDAYDLTQETFLRFIRYFNGYDQRYPLKKYLIKIAVNVANDYFKKPHMDDYGETIEALVAQQDDYHHGLLMRYLLALPMDQREALVLNKIYGYTSKEIAIMLNTNNSTIKSRIKLALDKLKQMAKEDQ